MKIIWNRDKVSVIEEERVLIGMAVKMYNTFQCLVDDARKVRTEACHHLKPLVETFIYFHWVLQGNDDCRVKLIIAKDCESKIRFFENNSGHLSGDGGTETYHGLKTTLQANIQGLNREWKAFKKTTLNNLALETSKDLLGWYNRVYRTACEPAHISDVLEYAPRPKGPVHLGVQQISFLRVHVALDFGLQIMCDLLKNLASLYDFVGLDMDIAKIKAELDLIRALPAAQTAPGRTK